MAMAAQFAVLPFRAADPRPVAAAIARMARAGPIVDCDAVVASQGAGGTLDVSALSDAPGERSLGADTWARLLHAVSSGAAPARAVLVGAGVSSSFLEEVHESLLRCRVFLAIVASELRPAMLLEALDRFPAVRLIYGPLPERALVVLGHGSDPAPRLTLGANLCLSPPGGMTSSLGVSRLD